MVETQVSPSRYARFMFIEALTPMHPGQGRGGEIVDLMVQRDEFEVPVIWSSSLKGAMRSSITLNQRDNAHGLLINAVFGPEPATEDVSDYASAIIILDAKLLFMPVRSLRGIWAYATSPHLLNYYKTYQEALKPYNNRISEDAVKKLIETIDGIADGNALVSSKSIIQDGKAVLNEVEFKAEPRDKLANLVRDIIPSALADRITKQGLVIVNDNDMMGLIRKSMIVQPRIRLEYDKKTVKPGGLWEEEYLPQYTVFVSGVICGKPRLSTDKFIEKLNKNKNLDEKVKNEIQQLFEKMRNNAKEVCEFLGRANESPSKDGTLNIIFGGKETLGKGLARIWWYP